MKSGFWLVPLSLSVGAFMSAWSASRWHGLYWAALLFVAGMYFGTKIGREEES